VVAARGGAVVVEERDLDPDSFWSEVARLLSDRPRMEAMSRDIRECFPSGSAERVARMVLEAAGEAV
jgi:UDP-N-acetylglucosamine:LPS N-acetylglucosamine transferase